LSRVLTDLVCGNWNHWLGLTKRWARLSNEAEPLMTSVRAKVEHPFHVAKEPVPATQGSQQGAAKDEP
jgi:hypothetical protein